MLNAAHESSSILGFKCHVSLKSTIMSQDKNIDYNLFNFVAFIIIHENKDKSQS